ncbi:nitrous oxide-stimulated promoter family protein [Dysgonomonas sp. 216]|uniref:nitrous oxide-stimulated promoter family protein n=1 Tax=Dysgonomonas sp. 216 TaxID=2302934 RepID=UPI0013CFD6CD|nr:nitrous oxide-stimulated promoter family protein [Dysgonomonas sp. 216]NDW17528.1 nitrous oxide-stimulated promoter family protein [Dysgonomonas sp. 216]
MNERDKTTVSRMIAIYCRSKHRSTSGICEACKLLENYARLKLEKCRFGESKPSCKICPIHCYKPDMKEQIRTVMRYAGPRMIFHYPFAAIMHLFNGRKSGRRFK